MLIFFVIIMAQMSYGQQLPLYSQYLYNKFLINPSQAGSDGFTSYNLTAREQWVGYSGAPSTYSVSWQTRMLKRKYRLKQNIFDETVYVPKSEGRVGLGGYIFSDRNGLVSRTGFQTAYSYHIWVRDLTQLSFGLALTGYYYRIDVNDASFGESSEPLLNDKLRRGIFVPDFDCGIYLLNPKFDVGLSGLQLAGAAARFGNSAYKNYWMDRHFYLFGSYDINSGTKNILEPAVLVKMSEQLKPQADIGLTYIHNQSFWAGLAYRTGSALIATVRFKYVTNNLQNTTLFFGYAYDFTLNEIQSSTYGTHEITVALKFGNSARRFRWLDRY